MLRNLDTRYFEFPRVGKITKGGNKEKYLTFETNKTVKFISR